jgi:hypothetical protein
MKSDGKNAGNEYHVDVEIDHVDGKSAVLLGVTNGSGFYGIASDAKLVNSPTVIRRL